MNEEITYSHPLGGTTHWSSRRPTQKVPYEQ